MAFIKAFAGALGGALADQWIDFYTLPDGLPATVAVCKAARSNNNRPSPGKASDCVITDGSCIVVPEGYALITMENGLVTGYVDEPGGFVWRSDDINSKSFFAGGTAREALVQQAWHRFTFDGKPGVSQIAIYVNLKEIPDNRFGTQNELYWDDSYLHTQAGAIARGTYTLRIVDPVLFLRNFVPAAYYSFNTPAKAFDFADFENKCAEQLFNEVVASLSAAFSSYANAGGAGRISRIQGDVIGFTQALAEAVDHNYQWRAERGIEMVKAALVSVDYDATTKKLLANVQRADALSGSRASSNLQASFAEGIQTAGQNPDGGAMGMAFMNFAMSGNPAIANTQQQPANPATTPIDGQLEKLVQLKQLLDQGVITQEDYDAVKRKTLGI